MLITHISAVSWHKSVSNMELTNHFRNNLLHEKESVKSKKFSHVDFVVLILSKVIVNGCKFV